MHYRAKKKANIPNEVKEENFEELVKMKRALQMDGYKKHRGIRNKIGGVTTHRAQHLYRSVDVSAPPIFPADSSSDDL